MSQYVGGLRARLVRESVYQTIRQGLSDLGWFDSGRRHLPITFLDEAVGNSTEVAFNTAAVSDESQTSTEEELGSLLSEHRWTFYVDFYGQSDALSTHFIHDVRDVLGGRFPSIGRTEPSVAVHDWSQATPGFLFYVGIENLLVDRAHVYNEPRLSHWYALRFEVVDNYSDENY